MKKGILIWIFVILSNITVSRSLDNYAYYTKEIESTKHVDLQGIDYEFADYFLTKTKINRELADEFLIILPDVRILEEQRKKISKFGKDVIVFMLKEKNEKLKYRSFEELNNVKFAKNVKIITLSLDDEEIDRVITDVKNDSLYFQDYFKYKFYGKYKKITRFNHLEVINHE